MERVEGIATVDDVDEFVARLDEIATRHGSTLQAFDARYVVGREHLELAVDLAERERERGEAIVDDESVEILLYAAGRRQIDRALEMGVSEGDCPVVVVVVGGAEDGAADDIREMLTPADTLGEHDPDRVRSFFDVSERELAVTDGTLEDVIRERVAMLVVER